MVFQRNISFKDIVKISYNRGADPRASQEPQGACTRRLREAQSGPAPCSGARRQNKVLDEVSAAIPGDAERRQERLTSLARFLASRGSDGCVPGKARLLIGDAWDCDTSPEQSPYPA